MRYFLDPNELHGLGDRVLRAALHTFDVNVQDLDLQKAVVKAEESLGKVKTKKGEVGCTLDLLIEIDGIYVLVEHKINSGEGEGLDETTGQVARYDKAVAKNLPHITESNSTRVYLTRTGKEAKGDVDWIPVAHRDLLRSFVAILEDASLSAVALHNLCAFLWDLLMGPIGIDALRLSELRNHINGALHNPPQSIRLKQWCDTNDIPWQNIIYILEKSYG